MRGWHGSKSDATPDTPDKQGRTGPETRDSAPKGRGKTFVSGRLQDNAEARREQKNRRVTGRKFALIGAISGEGTGSAGDRENCA